MISIIVPCYQKQTNIMPIFNAIHEIMCQEGWVYELIFVDDGSKDQTANAIKEMCTLHSQVRGIILNGNFGQQNATLAGIRSAQYQYVLTMDDDLQYELEILKELVAGLLQGVDVVYGVPTNKHIRRYRRWGTDLKEWVFSAFCNKPKQVRLTSCRGMQRDLVDFVNQDSVMQVYISARILQKTQNILNIPMKPISNKQVPSRYHFLKLVKVLVMVLCNYTRIPCLRSFRKTGTQYNVKERFN